MTRKKTTAVIAAAAAILVALLTTGATGVLASWQSSTWGESRFGTNADYQPTGYARSVAAKGGIGRLITDNEVEGTYIEHGDQDPGSSATGWQSFSTRGLLGLFNLDVDGNSAATFDPSGSTSSTGATVPVADSLSQMRNLAVRTTLISQPNLKTTGTFSTSAVCPIDGSAPSAGPLVPGTLQILNQNVPIPGPNSTYPFEISNSTRTFRGYLTHTETTTAQSAASELHLYVEQYLGISHEWTLDMDLVRADCGIGVAPPALTRATGPSAPTTTEDDSETAVDGGTEAESEAGGESDAAPGPEAGSDAAEAGPTSPVTVAVGERFDVVAKDGTRLGTATVEQVDRTAPDEAAVQLTVTTSAENGDRRLAQLTADDFRQLVGTELRPAAGRSADGAPFPDRLEPGTEYTGWVSFTIDDAASRMMWIPVGTAGWIFGLPDAPEPPPTVAPTPEVPPAPSPAPAPDTTVPPVPESTEPDEPASPTPEGTADPTPSEGT
ncbi:hypothetical protein [Rhodococcus sp. HNM0569]|uniref:hypothetical protein n=1 Tax=Rhodococcus sp. HNM0569 TaxID=2716340 RepID=UPI00146D3F74|nr:hypothetical protein [Rhodococcus sp. HNM0569]NLU84540.1 hypothetical protein [Rhodococcus sp. HNM0569]